MSWQEKAKDLKFNQGLSWKETTDIIQREYFPYADTRKIFERVRSFIRSLPEYKAKNTDTSHNRSKVKFSAKDNSWEYEDIQQVINGREITPEIIMEAHRLLPSEWEVTSFCSNVWQQQTKYGGKIDLCQSKLTVRPKKQTEITFEDIDRYFKNKDFKCMPTVKPFPYNESEEILEINYTDLHVGLLAWREETGADFDLNIIEQRFKESIADIIHRCRGRKFKLIRFITIGDILHIDNENQTTTKGTFQQADGRIAKIFDRAADLLLYALNTLLELKTPIEYVYLSGNHDRNTGYFLAHTTRNAFKKNSNIEFDISPNPLKVKIYGNSLVGYCHGDMPEKNIGTWLIKSFRKEYGQTQYAEIHSGHLHSDIVKEVNGIKVIRSSTLCESSYWEHQQGYKSERALICYVWNESAGKRETWITNF